MADAEKLAPIIVIKKKQGHGGHHGGAWKVAYADFVTAMMALFIVLWLLSSSEEVQKAVGGYFNDPTGSGNMAGATLAGVGESLSLTEDEMDKLKDRLEQALQQIPHFDEMREQIQMIVTSEGLRIELMETNKGMFFDSGSANPSENGKELLRSLARQIGTLPNDVAIEGHTDSKPFAGANAYTNWELSADRANSARRHKQDAGMRPGQVKQIRGFADQQLRTPNEPENPQNRRVSVIVKYLKGQEPKANEPAKKAPAHAPSH